MVDLLRHAQTQIELGNQRLQASEAQAEAKASLVKHEVSELTEKLLHARSCLDAAHGELATVAASRAAKDAEITTLAQQHLEAIEQLEKTQA